MAIFLELAIGSENIHRADRGRFGGDNPHRRCFLAGRQKIQNSPPRHFEAAAGNSGNVLHPVRSTRFFSVNQFIKVRSVDIWMLNS